MHSKSCILLLCGVALTGTAVAQAVPANPSHEVDLSLTYTAQRSNLTTDPTFWQNGGSMEFSAVAIRGFGAAVRASGGHGSNIAGSGIDLDTFNITAGPRYTISRRSLSIFGEGLLGESFGIHGVFPRPSGARNSSRTVALQVGGGLDFHSSKHFAFRPIEAHWLRTEFPNSTTNVQNTLQLGAGIVWRLQR